MSKRFMYPQQNGDRKKARLDVTISDHNFPLSQNPGQSKDLDNWGDDNDDEILLLASQACEDVYINESLLPDYSMCMQPASTSTQMFAQPGSSTPKSFSFKKPSTTPTNIITSQLKDKCNRISSPLPGISAKLIPNNDINITDDLIFNDKIYKGQDSEHIYRQFLQLQEENTKLKSENGKLLEKCVTKEGEASILRTQLKTCQVAVDNARMEKIKAQEKAQMDWTEKLATANGQVHDLRTQLDFKNLEIISVKEKCKMLESSKIKLTQVSVPHNDISSSHKNNSFLKEAAPPARRVKVSSSGVQTESKAHFLKLHNTVRLAPSKLTAILPLVLEPTTGQQCKLLDYNEKLQKHTELSTCTVFSKFNRLPSTPAVNKEAKKVHVDMNGVYEDITCIVAGDFDEMEQKYFNIFKNVKAALIAVKTELEAILRRITTAFQKEMDERYIETSSTFFVVNNSDLLCGRALYKEEQAILARRMASMLAHLLECSRSKELLEKFEKTCDSSANGTSVQIVELLTRICDLLDSTSCAIFYSGFLLSIAYLAEKLFHDNEAKLLEVFKFILTSRPLSFVIFGVLRILKSLSMANVLSSLCPKSNTGNLKMDYDQGVVLYKKDSCLLQVLLKQSESSLKCMEKQNLINQVVDTTRHLITLHNNMSSANNFGKENSRCDCQRVLLQVIVYGLRICAMFLRKGNKYSDKTSKETILPLCRSGIKMLYQYMTRDIEFCSHLSHNEGHLIEFCETLRLYTHSEIYETMLLELAGTFQPTAEEMPSSFHRQPWLKSFETFSLVD